ncbi:MAG: hypothetical protein R2764_01895 [Bacteroidales bacterium]
MEQDTTLIDLQVDGTTVAGFAPATLSYDVVLPYGTSNCSTVTAYAYRPTRQPHVVNPATLPGTTTVVVTYET